MLNDSDGYGIYRNTSNNCIYSVEMPEHRYHKDADRGQHGAEPLEFVQFVRSKRGKPNKVATQAKVGGRKKRYEQQFARTAAREFARAS